MWKPAVLIGLEKALERFGEESRLNSEALRDLIHSSERLRESSEAHRQAYEDQRQFMLEVLLSLEKRDREVSRFFELHAARMEASTEATRKLMHETRDDVREEMREAREDDRAVRDRLFALIDEIRSWRSGPGPAAA